MATRNVIEVGTKFWSIHFDMKAEIMSIDIEKNECIVELTKPGGYKWQEDWVLSHTIQGFERSEYHQYY